MWLKSICQKLRHHLLAISCITSLNPSTLRPGVDLIDVFRSNANYQWQILEKRAETQAELKKLSTWQGVVTGDFHFMNFGLFRTSQNRWKLGLIDLDEVRSNAFAFEFIRSAVGFSAWKIPLNHSEMLTYYLKGLQGQTPQIPENIKALEAQSDNLNDLRKKAVKKWIDKSRQDFEIPSPQTWKVLALKDLNQDQLTWVKNSKEALLKVDSQLNILASQIRMKLTGGSQGQIRQLFWVKSEEGTTIFEVKELPLRSDLKSSLKKAQSLYQEESTGLFTSFQTVGSTVFLVRERIEPKQDIVFEELSDSSAYAKSLVQWLGLKHRAQMQASEVLAYTQALSEARNSLELEMQFWLKQFTEGILSK